MNASRPSPRFSPELEAWRQAGEIIRLEPAGLDVFACQIGSPAAAPERTLLLLHGFPESSYSYHKIIEGMKRRFDRIVLFDFPGYGFSAKPPEYSYSLFEQADVALGVWERLGVGGGHVVSHDMGTSVATELLARARRNLLPAFLSAGLLSITITNGNLVMELAKLRVLQSLLRTRFGPFFSRLSRYAMFARQVRSANGGSGLTERDIELLWEAFSSDDGKLRAWQIIKYLDERDRFQNARWLPALKNAPLPIHFCWGAADRVAPVAIAEHLKDVVCPAATLTLMPGVGHFAQLDNPAVWVDSVLAFYDGL